MTGPSLIHNAEPRFWAKVDKSGGDGSCWPWTRGIRGGGYGAFWTGERVVTASRFAWQLANKQEPPNELCVCHTCDNRSCCNPAHLYLADHQTNLSDSGIKNRYPKHTGMSERRTRARRRRPQLKRLLELLGTHQAVADVLGLSKSQVFSLFSRPLAEVGTPAPNRRERDRMASNKKD